MILLTFGSPLQVTPPAPYALQLPVQLEKNPTPKKLFTKKKNQGEKGIFFAAHSICIAATGTIYLCMRNRLFSGLSSTWFRISWTLLPVFIYLKRTQYLLNSFFAEDVALYLPLGCGNSRYFQTMPSWRLGGGRTTVSAFRKWWC